MTDLDSVRRFLARNKGHRAGHDLSGKVAMIPLDDARLRLRERRPA
jgi:hypothetical protein